MFPGLKDLQSLCVCDQDPTGHLKKLLSTGIPEKYSRQGSPGAENFLFGNAVLSFTDLNNGSLYRSSLSLPSSGPNALRHLLFYSAENKLTTSAHLTWQRFTVGEIEESP
jgi:hypothetical protein